MVAEKDDALLAIVQFVHALRDGLHRNQSPAFNVANGVLCRFPNIDQTKRHACIQECAHFGRGYLNWKFIHCP